MPDFWGDSCNGCGELIRTFGKSCAVCVLFGGVGDHYKDLGYCDECIAGQGDPCPWHEGLECDEIVSEVEILGFERVITEDARPQDHYSNLPGSKGRVAAAKAAQDVRARYSLDKPGGKLALRRLLHATRTKVMAGHVVRFGRWVLGRKKC